MRISSRSAIAIHILVMAGLATDECSGKLTSSVIAKWLDINSVTIKNILGQLKQAGLVVLPPGKSKEGVRVARPLDEMTLYDIFQAVESDDFKEVFSFHNRVAQRSISGKYLNDVIAKYSLHAIDSAMGYLRSCTVKDMLQELLEKERTGPYPNPRAFLNVSSNGVAKEEKQKE